MLAILTTHPIQYQVPLWQALARDGRVPFEVWYLSKHAIEPSLDAEFGKRFQWDIDLLEGYPHRFLEGADQSSPSSFFGCRLHENLTQRLRSAGATALWIQGWQVLAYWQAIRAAREAGVEVWLRGESNDLMPVPLWKRPIKELQLRWLFSRVDRFFYIGSANRRLYENFGVPGARLFPAPYAVDNERFARQGADLRKQRTTLRRQWKIPDDAFCILFCGKFIAKKRPMDLVAAARILSGSGARVHLLFTGSGVLGEPLRRACRVMFDAEASAASSSDPGAPAASFAGFLNQTEISKAYVAADCLVLPSDHSETWGLVVNEALATGLTCLVSDACGCAEDLAPDHRFRCADPASLADMLRRNLTSPASPSRPPGITATVDSVCAAYSLLSAANSFQQRR